MSVSDGEFEHGERIRSAARQMWMRGVRFEHIENMHHSVREHYARLHNLDNDDATWGAISGHLRQSSQGWQSGKPNPYPAES